jgi:hypothetical protein
MALEIVYKSYTPQEFSQYFPIGKRFYSRKWSQEVSNGLYCEYDEGFPKFLKIITQSGAELSGKLTYYWDNDFLRIFPLILKKSEYYILQYQIPMKDIISISVLGRSFPYKFAYDWHVERSKFSKYCLVAVQLNTQTITGRLLDVHKAFINYEKFSPITFDIADHPEGKVVREIPIGDIRAIRILPYTRKSVQTLEQDRSQMINQSLESQVYAVAISLVEEYLKNDVPDELPKAFYDDLMKNSSPVA